MNRKLNKSPSGISSVSQITAVLTKKRTLLYRAAINKMRPLSTDNDPAVRSRNPRVRNPESLPRRQRETLARMGFLKQAGNFHLVVTT